METKKICKECGRELEINMFSRHPRTADGYTNVCKECMSRLQSEGHKNRKEKKEKQIVAEVQNARNLRLADFSPRELIQRLKDLGYEGKLTYTRVETIDLSNF